MKTESGHRDIKVYERTALARSISIGWSDNAKLLNMVNSAAHFNRISKKDLETSDYHHACQYPSSNVSRNTIQTRRGEMYYYREGQFGKG
jgi:hypothetical protein